MFNYNKIASNVQAELHPYIKKITENSDRVSTKFIAQMIEGITKGSSVLLTEIARNSNHKTSIKKTTQRLFRNLENINLDNSWQNYCSQAKNILLENPLFYMDDTEITKPLSKKMEALCLVRDGSDDGKLKHGYWVNEVISIAKNGQPVSVLSEIYSTNEKYFLSANAVRNRAVIEVKKNIGNGTFICDRGYDDAKFYQILIKEQQSFVIRVQNNRDVVHNGARQNIETFAKSLKGKHSFSVKFQDKAKEKLKAVFVKIELPKVNEPLTLVVVFGFSKGEGKPFMLLTNTKITGKKTCIKAVMDYLSRWKIEEYFKFKKQNYGFEKIRLLSLKANKNLNLLLSMVLGFLVLLSTSINKYCLIKISEPTKEKVAFIFYRLHRGLMQIMHLIKTAILQYLYPPKPPKQYDLFTYIKNQKRYKNLTKSQNGGF